MTKGLWYIITLLAGLATLATTPAYAARVIDDNDTVELHDNVHPSARAESDMGATATAQPMERMILSLKVPPDKKAALDQLLSEQQDPSSANFHKWLSPDEFGKEFGPKPEDIAVATSWLKSHGFTVENTGKGGTWINFSGSVAQVNRAFHTEIHDYLLNGEVRHANSTNPSIPRGLADVVNGPVSLHNFPRRQMNTGFRALASGGHLPDYTSGSNHYLSPIDFAAIYNLSPLYAAGIDGTGQTIAIVGRTHPASSDWSTFRSTMGLPANAPQVIVNGTDPGDLGSGEDGEADLDVEWSGAVAKNAAIKFVVSASTSSTDGVDLSAQYIVNNNLAPVMSTSFGQCESAMGAAENSFYNNLWSQAAAQGISAFVSSGDSGAAGCSAGSATVGSGAAVSGLASTPYNTAVGGTKFNDASGSFWNTSNGSAYNSAIGYIPEIAWNESGDVSGGSGLWASSGGVSSVYAKPSWQAAPGVPADGKRDVPDVALTAASHDGYLVETQGALQVVGGTSAASPSFAGIMAMVVQKTGQRQGNANIRLYQLASAQYSSSGPAIFHDTTSGNNSVPGVTGYSCGSGYDMVTGLGSVDANALVTNWAGAVPPDFTLSASPVSASVVQGGSVALTVSSSVSGGFNNVLSLSASGLPSGAAISFGTPSIAGPGSGSSTVTITTGSTTPTGTYAITITGVAGSVTHTASFSLTVTAAAAPNFTLSASPASVSVVQGNAAVTTVCTAVSGGFSNAVSLSASGLPSGATIAFSPASIAAPGSGSSTATITTGSTTPTGTYTVTITATGGTTTHTATVTLTVTAAGSTGAIFSDGFEGSGWSAKQVSGSRGSWSLAASGSHPTATPHGGARLAAFNSYTAASGSQTRIYRATGIAIPSAYTTITLQFWMYHDTGYPTYNDRIQPQISLDGVTWTNAGSAISRYNGATGWTQATVDLSAYKGKTVYLGFVGISAYGDNEFLDDVSIIGK